jgi:hypothetical protein
MVEHQAQVFTAKPFANDWGKAQLQGGFMDQEFVGIHDPLHHVFPQPIGGR